MPTAIVFPFDLFGNAGTGAGAQWLGDALREVVEDTAAETRPVRAACYADRLTVRELPFATVPQVRDWRKRGRRAAKEALAGGDFLLWLAGNHLGVLPLLEELSADDPAGTLVVQFDAHLDVYAFHDTTPELSHGNFLSHADGPLPRIASVGHRDLFLTPADVGEAFAAVYPAADVAVNPDRVAAELAKLAAGANRVWIDLDCDAIDPAFLPAVHQPMPFGLHPPTLLRLLDAVWSDKVLGLSVSEFDPGRDVRDAGLNLLGWLMEYVLLKRYENGRPG